MFGAVQFTRDCTRCAYGIIILSAGELNAIKVTFTMMTVSMFYRDVVDLYWFMFGTGYGPFSL